MSSATFWENASALAALPVYIRYYGSAGVPYHDENGQPYWITSDGEHSPTDPEVSSLSLFRAIWQPHTLLLLKLLNIQLLLVHASAFGEHSMPMKGMRQK